MGRWVALAVVVGTLAAGGVVAQMADTRTVSFRGIRPTDPGGRDGLRNPERGLRIETLIAEPPGSAAWGPAHHLKGLVPEGYTDDWWLLDTRRYEGHGLTLAQTYCYLDRYVGQPIPDEKLGWLRQSLRCLRANGLKAVLRFAYERDMDRKAGPTLEDIQRHLAQLRPIIRDSADVIFVLQAGFVGAWGEWHSSAQGLEQDHSKLAAVVAGVLEALPEGPMTQVRVPRYKRWVLEDPLLGGFREVEANSAHSGAPAARIGFHNDGFLAGETDGGTWPEPPHHGNPGNPEFDYMTRESPYVPVDGELFWSDLGGQIDGLRAAKRMRLHHYTSFSLAHSFSEREGKPYSIDAWMTAPITAEQVRQVGLPLSDGYFEDGHEVARTQFEYIRDHLGYRLELQRASFPAAIEPGGEMRVRLELVNRGFSVLYNPRPVCLVLIGPRDGVVAEWTTTADPRQWQPFQPGDETHEPLTHAITVEVRLPDRLPRGKCRLGLWMPDRDERLRLDPRYAVRVANRGVPWWTDGDGQYGVNIVGDVAR